MGKLTPHRKRDVLASGDAVNLDGKGLNGFLLDWYRTEPRGVVVAGQQLAVSAQ